MPYTLKQTKTTPGSGEERKAAQSSALSCDLDPLRELIPAQLAICKAGRASPLHRRQWLLGCMKDAQPVPVAGSGGPPGHDVHPLFCLHHTAPDDPATSWMLEALPSLELLKWHWQESYFLGPQ